MAGAYVVVVVVVTVGGDGLRRPGSGDRDADRRTCGGNSRNGGVATVEVEAEAATAGERTGDRWRASSNSCCMYLPSVVAMFVCLFVCLLVRWRGQKGTDRV